jgi:hypothetical protein
LNVRFRLWFHGQSAAILLSLQYPFNIHQTMDVVKGGINYRFGFGPH